MRKPSPQSSPKGRGRNFSYQLSSPLSPWERVRVRALGKVRALGRERGRVRALVKVRAFSYYKSKVSSFFYKILSNNLS